MTGRKKQAVASSGIEGLDEILRGGLPASNLYIIQGVPGAGIFSRRDREVAERVRPYRINVAKNGGANGPELPHLDAAADRDRLLLIANDRIASGDDPLSERLDRLASESKK